MAMYEVTKRCRNARGDDIWQIHVKGQGTSPDSPAIFKVQVPLHKESKEKAVGSKLVQAVQQKVDLLIIVDGSHAEAPDIWRFCCHEYQEFPIHSPQEFDGGAPRDGPRVDVDMVTYTLDAVPFSILLTAKHQLKSARRTE